MLKDMTGTDGSNPRFNLIVLGNSIYGATDGESDLSQSLVFKLNTDGSGYMVLKAFSTPDPVTGTNDDGYFIRSGLTLAGGALFGTTRWGGNFGSGVVFALTTDGLGYTVLRHFSEATNGSGSGLFKNYDGADPLPSLAVSDGVLFGATESGGSVGGGTLYSLNTAPQIMPSGENFGVRSNAFGFDVAGYSNQVAIVEACDDLAAQTWLPLQTNVVAGDPVYFSDQEWVNFPRRFYRVTAR